MLFPSLLFVGRSAWVAVEECCKHRRPDDGDDGPSDEHVEARVAVAPDGGQSRDPEDRGIYEWAADSCRQADCDSDNREEECGETRNERLDQARIGSLLRCGAVGTDTQREYQSANTDEYDRSGVSSVPMSLGPFDATASFAHEMLLHDECER